MTVDIQGLTFELSTDEHAYLMKLPEESRLFGLCALRYEFHVLTKKGKRKIDTMVKLQAKQAIRFAVAFFTHGQTGGTYEGAPATND